MKVRGEGIEVRRSPGARAPEAFLWRGRLYLVRAVLGHWKEPRPWWTERPAQVLRGEDTTTTIIPRDSTEERETFGTQRTAGLPSPEENEVWRVEASAGRMASSGIYDVLRVPESSGTAGTWQLLRVTD